MSSPVAWQAMTTSITASRALHTQRIIGRGPVRCSAVHAAVHERRRTIITIRNMDFGPQKIVDNFKIYADTHILFLHVDKK